MGTRVHATLAPASLVEPSPLHPARESLPREQGWSSEELDEAPGRHSSRGFLQKLIWRWGAWSLTGDGRERVGRA